MHYLQSEFWEGLKSYASSHGKFSILKSTFCNKVLLRLDHNLVEMLMPKNEESDSCLIHLWAGGGRKKMAFFWSANAHTARMGQNTLKDDVLKNGIELL